MVHRGTDGLRLPSRAPSGQAESGVDYEYEYRFAEYEYEHENPTRSRKAGPAVSKWERCEARDSPLLFRLVWLD